MKSGFLKKIIILLICVIILIFLDNIYLIYKKSIKTTELNYQVKEEQGASTYKARKPIIPSGKQTYDVVQNKDALPKIFEVTIDPPDVHVGQKQTLSIVVGGPDKIESVVAYIETDNGTTTLPLNFVGKISEDALTPPKYFVDENNKIVSQDDKSKDFMDKLVTTLKVKAQNNDLENYPKLKYENSWIVKDTHDRYYHTIFVVRDIAGRENSITLAWSDACGIPASGSWTISANCTISSADGVENGNAIISTYTLTLNAPFAWNPGYSVIVNSGAILIGSGGKLQKGYVLVQDVDGDNYPAAGGNGIWYSVSQTVPSGYKRRSQITYPNSADCDDNNPATRIYSGLECCVEQCPTVYQCEDWPGYYSSQCGVNMKCIAVGGDCKIPGTLNTVPNDGSCISGVCQSSGSQNTCATSNCSYPD